jgi:hypothetical protein
MSHSECFSYWICEGMVVGLAVYTFHLLPNHQLALAVITGICNCHVGINAYCVLPVTVR